MRKITGTLVWYYYVCKRELWLMVQKVRAEVSGIRFIPKDQLTNYYDLETGFKTENTVSIW